LSLGKGDDLYASFDLGLETKEGGVDCSTQRRADEQLDEFVGESLAECSTLFLAKWGEIGVVDFVVRN